jgi:hypothetical protein
LPAAFGQVAYALFSPYTKMLAVRRRGRQTAQTEIVAYGLLASVESG